MTIQDYEVCGGTESSESSIGSTFSAFDTASKSGSDEQNESLPLLKYSSHKQKFKYFNISSCEPSDDDVKINKKYLLMDDFFMDDFFSEKPKYQETAEKNLEASPSVSSEFNQPNITLGEENDDTGGIPLFETSAFLMIPSDDECLQCHHKGEKSFKGKKKADQSLAEPFLEEIPSQTQDSYTPEKDDKLVQISSSVNKTSRETPEKNLETSPSGCLEWNQPNVTLGKRSYGKGQMSVSRFDLVDDSSKNSDSSDDKSLHCLQKRKRSVKNKQKADQAAPFLESPSPTKDLFSAERSSYGSPRKRKINIEPTEVKYHKRSVSVNDSETGEKTHLSRSLSLKLESSESDKIVKSIPKTKISITRTRSPSTPKVSKGSKTRRN